MLDKVTKAYYNDHTFMEKLKNSPSISEANPETYDVIYFTGGHGVMFDFPHNMYIQDAVNEVYRQGGVVAAVCHGIAALLNVKDENGRYFIDRKQITGFSNAEEILANRKRIVPFMLESELKMRCQIQQSKSTIQTICSSRQQTRYRTKSTITKASRTSRCTHIECRRKVAQED